MTNLKPNDALSWFFKSLKKSDCSFCKEKKSIIHRIKVYFTAQDDVQEYLWWDFYPEDNCFIFDEKLSLYPYSELISSYSKISSITDIIETLIFLKKFIKVKNFFIYKQCNNTDNCRYTHSLLHSINNNCLTLIDELIFFPEFSIYKNYKDKFGKISLLNNKTIDCNFLLKIKSNNYKKLINIIENILLIS